MASRIAEGDFAGYDFAGLGMWKGLGPRVADVSIINRKDIGRDEVSVGPTEKPKFTDPTAGPTQLAHRCSQGLSWTSSQLLK